MSQAGAIPDRLMAEARAGDGAALGQRFELYRNDLRLIARSMLDQALRLQLDASDLVQETFLKAHRQFAGFAGCNEPQLIAWLRQILVRTLADQAHYHRRRSRNVRRQVSLEELLEQAGGAAQRRWPIRSRRPARWPFAASARSCWPTRWSNCRPTTARSSCSATSSISHSTRSPSA